jgi:hypothetical protein
MASGCNGERGGGKLNEKSRGGKAPASEGAARDLIADLNKAADILSTVQDEKSAQEAEPRLQAAVRRLRKTMKRFETFAPSRGEEARLRTKYWDALKKASQRLANEIEKVAGNEETYEALKGSLAEFEKLQKQPDRKSSEPRETRKGKN